MLKDEVTDIEIWNRLSQNYDFALRNSGRNLGILFGFFAVIYFVFAVGALNLFNHATQSGSMIKSVTHGYIMLFLLLSILGIVFSLIWIKAAKAAKNRVKSAKTQLMLYEISKFCDLDYIDDESYVDYLVEFMDDDDGIQRKAEIWEFAQEIKSFKNRKITKAEQQKIEENYFKFLGDKATLANPSFLEGSCKFEPTCANISVGYANLVFFLVCFLGCLMVFAPLCKMIMGHF